MLQVVKLFIFWFSITIFVTLLFLDKFLFINMKPIQWMSSLIILLTACSQLLCLTSRHVKCYSGDKLIYEGYSQGRFVYTENGFYFHDSLTGKPIEVSGNCIIEI